MKDGLNEASMLIQLEGITKLFGGIRAINGLDFSLKPKEILGLIGPNGSGKTTVFNVITGFYKPTSGKIHFESSLM